MNYVLNKQILGLLFYGRKKKMGGTQNSTIFCGKYTACELKGPWYL